jgi:hypothetical protein
VLAILVPVNLGNPRVPVSGKLATKWGWIFPIVNMMHHFGRRVINLCTVGTNNNTHLSLVIVAIG